MSLESDGAGMDASVAVTRLSNDASAGDRQAAAELLPLVYEQLRRLARRHMSEERPDQTLQATALVHEAYIRVAGAADGGMFRGRWHFFAAAAEAMRRILVEHARFRGRQKRGGGLRRLELDQLELSVSEPPDEILALDEGLSLLAEQHPEKARLVQLRYFAGLTIDEAAEALGVSVATANRHWAYARAWLFRHVTGDGADAHDPGGGAAGAAAPLSPAPPNDRPATK
jgi:RNA polymerase sigma factor (TIGR02999 family)